MKILSSILIEELKSFTQTHLEKAEEWKNLSLEILQKRPNEMAWNALECLEHLNYYGDFYISEIKRVMENSHLKNQEYFYSGILGNYFAKMMLPKEKGGKMNTFKEMNPFEKNLDQSVIDKFIKQQKELLDLLKLAESKNLTKIKTRISISKWIKLRLGDTFRVVIYHNFRHIKQAEKAILS